MTVKRTSTGTTRSVTVVSVEPIGLGELRYLRDALAEFAPDWCAELDGICADEATLVVVPDSGDDMTGPSFVVSRESYGYRLDLVHWDNMQGIGLFPSLVDIMAAIRTRLSLDMARLHPGTASLH